MAHRALRDAELKRGARHPAEAGSGLEGDQGIEGRQAGHPASTMNEIHGDVKRWRWPVATHRAQQCALIKNARRHDERRPQNKKLMQEIFAAVARGERATYVDRLADDVTMTVTGQYSWSRTFRGKDSVMRDLYGYVASRVQEQRRTIPIRVLAEEDWVVVEAVADMMTREGVRYDNQYCLLYRLRERQDRRDPTSTTTVSC